MEGKARDRKSTMASIIRAVEGAHGIPTGFPILFNDDMTIIEPAFAWLVGHTSARSRSGVSDTVRTYGEHIYDWFDTLEQSGLDWRSVDEGVLAEYRNRMLETPSQHTKRPYSRSTINARVGSVCRFYEWAMEEGLVSELPFRRHERTIMGFQDDRGGPRLMARNTLTLSQPEKLPRPLRVDELARLFAKLGPTPRLAAEWALTAGLRRKEICGFTIDMVPNSHKLALDDHPLVGVPIKITKGDYPRTVYPPIRLIDRTDWYVGEERARIVRHARAKDRNYRPPSSLLLTTRGTALSRKRLTALFAQGFSDADLTGSFHWLRHTFAMVMLVRLQRQAHENPDMNPLKILQVLMGHQSITTTAVYLRCVEVHDHDLSESLAWLYGELIPDAE
jgi:integrase/recombinase XerD